MPETLQHGGMGSSHTLRTSKVSSNTPPQLPEHRTTTDQSCPLEEDSPRHPYSWSKIKKWTHVTLFSTIEFLTPLASMMFAPAVPQVAEDIADSDITRTTLAVSIYVLGFVVGPLVFGPLSQIYGRIIIYRTTVACYVIMSVCCAVSNSIDMLTVFRFFAGCFGAAPIVLGGAAVADMYPAVCRGRPMAVYSVGPFLGLTTGPIFGGLIDYYFGWRWIFWALSISAGALSFLTFAVLRETHWPTISKSLASPSRNLGQRILASREALQQEDAFGTRLRTVLRPALLSPFRITFSNLQLFLLFASNAVFTGIMNILFTTLGATYQSRYQFTTQLAGLAYIGIGVGGLVASVVLSSTSDRLVRFMSRRFSDSEKQHLERYRLPPLIAGDLLASAGLIWYGWAVQARTTWIVPLTGSFIFGLGMLSIQASFPTYLIHAYSDQAGAVLSASVVTRSIGGSTLTLAGPSLNLRLGYGWASTLLACLNLMFLLPAIVLYRRPTTRLCGSEQNHPPEPGTDAQAPKHSDAKHPAQARNESVSGIARDQEPDAMDAV